MGFRSIFFDTTSAQRCFLAWSVLRNCADTAVGPESPSIKQEKLRVTVEHGRFHTLDNKVQQGSPEVLHGPASAVLPATPAKKEF